MRLPEISLSNLPEHLSIIVLHCCLCLECSSPPSLLELEWIIAHGYPARLPPLVWSSLSYLKDFMTGHVCALANELRARVPVCQF